MRIYLVGFMGSGKSTLGQRVALSQHVPCFDSATITEAQSGMTIPEIFETFGEHYFRQLEADILRKTTIYPKSINATGGGLPCYEDNMAWMNTNGITMYLQWPDEVLLKHVIEHRKSRPLLSHLDNIKAEESIATLLQSRKPVYEQAAITLELKGNLEADFLVVEKACKYIW